MITSDNFTNRYCVLIEVPVTEVCDNFFFCIYHHWAVVLGSNLANEIL